MIVAQIVLYAVAAYLLIGLAIGVPFVLKGVDQVDEAARGTSLVFRLLILPGAIALWPLMAAKWLRAVRGGRAA
jgi:hypothetical protein